MTQEYVVVEDPHAPRERPDRDGATSRRRVRAALLTGAALAFVAMGAALAWPDRGPDPVPEPDDRAATAARITAVVYQEWLDRNVLVECMEERGFPYEVRIVDHADSLETVAQFLGLEPSTAHPDAPVPLLRQPDLYLGRGGAAMAERTRGGSACTMPPRTSVSTLDDEALERAVASAREDERFLTTVAEQVWVEQHPAQVTHAISLLRQEGAIAGEAGPWSEAVEAVAAVVQERAVWVPVVTGSEESFAQAVGLTDGGGAVAVRVGDEAASLDRDSYLTRTDAIACGPVTISAGVKNPWGTTEELANVMDALGPACNALIGAGIVEGESLADVYWD
ncbi:hypothetical protein [Demequina sp. SO4-18]|uniref:hypothetical protein n=1 Tax=Demequina sp. SO4-18 TaxID=3401026 RepID=UPI003B5BCE09